MERKKCYCRLGTPCEFQSDDPEGWISVEDEPVTDGSMDEEEKLLLLLQDGRRVIANYADRPGVGRIYYDGYEQYDPVAWQPLPKGDF